jgi:hypothetical protein
VVAKQYPLHVTGWWANSVLILPKGPAKVNSKNTNGGTVIVVDLSFKYLWCHLYFGIRSGGTFW